MMQMMSQGAEAKIFAATYMERDAVIKIRPGKGYRHAVLDERLRSSRTKNEAKLMREARAAGVRTPVIYDIDTKECSITMERIAGETVKDVLDKHPERSDEVCVMIGMALAKLHNAKISHGDLTTSNMILTPDGELCLIDLSMGGMGAEIEDMGVDIHLMKRAFTSAHSSMERQLDLLIGTYEENTEDGVRAVRKVEEIRSRGRYT